MNGSRRSAIGGGALITLVALLAGCSAGPANAPAAPVAIVASDPPADPTPTATPTLTRTPTPTPTVSASDPSTWAIDFDGVGPAKLGAPMAVDQAALAQLNEKSEPPCPIAVYSGDATPSIILVPDVSGTVTAIDVFGLLWSSSGNYGRTPRTYAGIGADSTLAELLAAYPTIQKTGGYSFLDYYGITNGSGHWMDFAVDRETGDIWGIQLGLASGIPRELCG